MGVFRVLSDYGEFDYGNGYNGPLKDYVDSYDDNQTLFKQLLEINPDCYLYKDYNLIIHQDLISNKKIGYRDIMKVPSERNRLPYILYFKVGDKERSLILFDFSYIEARGAYYCLTEPGSEFEQERSDIVVCCLEKPDEVIDCFTTLQDENNTAGYIQKKLDNLYIKDFEAMKDKCIELAEKIFDDTLSKTSETIDKHEKENLVYQCVLRVFLLKKSLYVRYMTNKFMLNDRHCGNSVEQRKFAKAYIDEIKIVPYYLLWNNETKVQEAMN